MLIIISFNSIIFYVYNMKTINADIVVCGGGLSGIICSLALSRLGISVCTIEKSKYDLQQIKDTRSTAYLVPSINFLAKTGIWEHLSNDINPLKILSIINSKNKYPFNQVLNETHFNAKEISKDYFGYNISNYLTKKILINLIKKDELINFINDEIINIENFEKYLTINLKNKYSIKTKLLIGADGKNSFIRNYYNIKTQITNLEQKAVTFITHHKKPHNNISYEIYNTGGPFTTVPLKSNKEKKSAVIWVNDSIKINKLLSLNKLELQSEINKRSCNKLGEISIISDLQSSNVSTQIADKFVDHRMILIGEAAHALPPIGAQGLNLTIRDIRVIFELIRKYQDSIGSNEMVAEFNFKRFIDVKMRTTSVNILNKISHSDNLINLRARDFGLILLQKVKPIKYLLMRFGLA